MLSVSIKSFCSAAPPIPDNYTSLVEVNEKAYNRFSIQISPGLLVSTNGPITHFGVLVTNNLPGWLVFLPFTSGCCRT